MPPLFAKIVLEGGELHVHVVDLKPLRFIKLIFYHPPTQFTVKVS